MEVTVEAVAIGDLREQYAELRLLHLVGDLLTVASGALTIEARDADLIEVVRHCVQAAEPKAKAGGITLDLIASGTAPGHFGPRPHHPGCRQPALQRH